MKKDKPVPQVGALKAKSKEDLPSYIVIVLYDEKSLSVSQKRSGVTAARRFLYVYPHEDFNERMSAAWKAGATAIVYRADYKIDGEVQATDVKGVWR